MDTMKNLKYNLAIGLLFILASFLIGYPRVANYLGANKNKQGMTFSTIEQANPPNTKIIRVEGKPSRIIIPSLDIDLQIEDGYYDDKSKSWTLSDSHAMYAVMTPLVNNQSGNTFIYGHNVSKVFEKLPRLSKGGEAVIITENNHRFVYRFEHSLETTPGDSSLLGYQGAAILTLQTCSGIWSQNRLLMTFSLVEYS